jgi:Flp pilus assembly protein TadD
MRHWVSIGVCVMTLTACSLEPQGNVMSDPAKELEALDGPNVEGVAATIEKSAREALAAGDNKRAGQFYKQLYDTPKISNEDKHRFAIGLAEASRRSGDNTAALASLEEVLKADPKNVEALESKGLAQLADGKVADAGRTFEQVMQSDAKRWRTLNALGILFTTKQMIPEAMAYYTEALKYSADNPSILNNVGLSFAIERRFDKSIEALQRAGTLANGDSFRKRQIELNLAMVMGISGDLDGARDLAVRHLKGPALDNNLGVWAHLASNDELARAYLNTALSGSPIHYERAWNNLAVITEQSKGGAVKAKNEK